MQHMETASPAPPPHYNQPHSPRLPSQVLEFSCFLHFLHFQVDPEQEHVRGARGFHPSCRKMEEPKLVSCCFFGFLVNAHILTFGFQLEQLPDDG